MEIQRTRTSIEVPKMAGAPLRTGSASPSIFGKLRQSLDSAMNARDSFTSVEEEARQRVEPGRELRKGWLMKQGKGMLAGTRWRRRFFALYPQALAYWWDSADLHKGRAPKAVIALQGCSVAVTDATTKKRHTFGVFHTTRQDIFFQADTEEDMMGWLEVLEEEMGVTKDCVTLADFTTLALLGRGASGSVVQVRKKDTGVVYAMKMIKKDLPATPGAEGVPGGEREEMEMAAGGRGSDDLRKAVASKGVRAKLAADSAHNAQAMANITAVQTERRILEVVNHPFIVTLHFAFHTKEHLCFVMDFVAGGELYSLIAKDGRFEEPRARFYSAELILALEYLHEVGIVYRDLKPENILLGADGHLLITDFGQSKYSQRQQQDPSHRSSSIVGSAYYMAPEIFMKKGHGPEADWWSLGVLIYEMLVGLPPCYCSNTVEAYRKLLTEQVEYPEHLSNPAVELLQGLLKVKPSYRTGAKDPAGYDDASETSRIRMKWNMPWFGGTEWERILAKKAPAPYKPEVRDDDDLSNFSASFTTQEVPVEAVREGLGQGARSSTENKDRDPWFHDFAFVRSSDDFSRSLRPPPSTKQRQRRCSEPQAHDGAGMVRSASGRLLHHTPHHTPEGGGDGLSRTSSGGSTGTEAQSLPSRRTRLPEGARPAAHALAKR